MEVRNQKIAQNDLGLTSSFPGKAARRTMVPDGDTNTSNQTAQDGLSESYFCTSCQISFGSGQEQRLHSKEPWHVYNMKRRIASLPPVSSDAFEDQIPKRVDKKAPARVDDRIDSSDEELSDFEGEPTAWPFQCLFCNQSFGCDDIGFGTNLEHMRTVHGMFIPDQDMVFDLQSLIGYLATVVREWHECLYCGANKPSTSSCQSHMRAKGHCMLNTSREPELLDFWDRPLERDGEDSKGKMLRTAYLSETEMALASGKVIGSKYATPTTRRASTKTSATTPVPKALTSGHENSLLDKEETSHANVPSPSSSRQIARREQLGIAGLSLQTRQAVMVAEKRAQRCEAMATQAREWVYGRGANAQKFDQIDGKGKWGKQNHKLQPR